MLQKDHINFHPLRKFYASFTNLILKLLTFLPAARAGIANGRPQLAQQQINLRPQ